jgi:hypothetical protein
MKNSSDTIGNRTPDFPVCRAVPQPTAPPRPPNKYKYTHKMSLRCLKQDTTIERKAKSCGWIFVVDTGKGCPVKTPSRHWKEVELQLYAHTTSELSVTPQPLYSRERELNEQGGGGGSRSGRVREIPPQPASNPGPCNPCSRFIVDTRFNANR